MKLAPIILRLRTSETVFNNDVAGAAELALAMDNTLLKEVAFVIPLAENANANQWDNGINQRVTERFGIIIAIKNDASNTDKLGLTSYDRLDTIRTELFKAILGWLINGAESPISYRGANLLDINGAWIWYQYEFEYDIRLTNDSGVDMPTTGMFDTLYAQYALSPNADLPITEDLPISSFDLDMAQIVDLTEDLDAGGFTKGFATGFDWWKG